MAEVEFFGERFGLRPKVSEWALMKFAKAASAGEDGDTMQGMTSMLNLIEKCIVPEDWARFDRVADSNDAEAADLVKVIDAAFQAVAERPTGRSSDSSDGPSPIQPKPVLSSVDRVSPRLASRPDLAHQVELTKRMNAAATG